MHHTPLILGAHVSIAGGLYKAVERAESIGCNALQIFTKSGRQWHAHPITQEAINAFKQAINNSTIDINNVVVHASYLINIASQDPKIATQSIQALSQELYRCEQLGIQYLVVHPGTATSKDDKKDALKRVAHAIIQVLKAVHGHTHIVIENMAGQGNSLGSTFDELAYIINHTQSHASRISIAIDTCHLFASGYDFSNATSYAAVWKKFDTSIGMDRLKVIHLNDSKKDFGSHVDRHEKIGHGRIPSTAFALLCNDKKLASIPKILEVPYRELHELNADVCYVKSLII